jgi:uncharacterized phage protein gp47/JayE
LAELFTFVVRDTATIRDGILRTIRNGLIQRGIANPNVTPGSDWYVLAQAVANQLAVTEANAVVKADEQMPDTAEDDALVRICDIYGLTRQPAAGSTGTVELSSSAATTITTGDQLVDGAGLTYEVVTGGIYNDGDLVPIQAVSTGEATNLEEGEILRWVSTPAFADEKAEVGPGGLVNGIDEENDEVLRQRLLARLQTPAGSGNSAHVAEWAEASTPSVQKAFPYPCAQGAATVHVAVTAKPTETNKNRDIAAGTMAGTVTPYIQGQLPEHVHSVITTVTNVNADVAFGLALPEAATANPPGPGGGWKNGSPWPAPDFSSAYKCAVSAVTSSTVFTVDALTSPTAFVSKIAWLSPTDWTLYQATVIAVSGTSGAYVITLDKPFTGITVGCFIWPDCENAQAYVDAVLDQFAVMGPGEKTSNASLLTRAFRRPRTAAGWPYTLGNHLCNAITAAEEEVDVAQFAYRTDGTTTVNGSAGNVSPQIPAAITDPPKIFVPRHLAFYRIPA